MTDRRSRVRAFLRELRRRKVFRVVAAYLVIGWGLIEVSSTVFPLAGLPAWSPRLVLVLTILGFPAALLLAWAFDITPEGIRRSDSSTSPERWSRVQGLLGTALALPEAEREAYVRRTAAGDEALLADVVSLLKAHARSGPLDRPVGHWLEPAPIASAPTPGAEGRQAAHYEILDSLGGGGMGVVYRARDTRLERIVALKFLPSHLSHDAQAKQRFTVEAQAAAALDHPNICTLLEIGETAHGELFLAMPYYEGETLERRLARGRLSLPEALHLATQAASGLAAAHGKGIVHRDVKPANLMITREGVLKILDFGIAKLTDASITAPGLTPGTLAYMSPEQARGDVVDARTDVWSLGVVLYEALAGRRPFVGLSEQAILEAIRRADPDPLTTHRPDIPPQLDAIVRRALAPRPADRYESAAALQEALVALARDGAALHPGGVAPADAEPEPEVAASLTPEGERRQATVVVSTVDGYAALVESRPRDEVQTILARVRSAADDVAARFGGHVNACEDDRVELLFGVPLTHEDHCFRAVRAALELHERIRGMEPLTRSGNVRLRLHSAIDTGQVVAQPAAEGTRLRVIGPPAENALRLQAFAGADELWITPACQRLVGPFFDSAPGQPVPLAGAVAIPHKVLRLSGLRTRIEAGQRTGLTRYVGRERELATLREALGRARQGHGRVVAVQGEAGVGKSRLLHEFRAGEDLPELTFLEGRCQAFGGAVAYLPFVEILRAALGVDDVEPAERAAAAVQAVRRIGAELEELIPLFLHLLSLPHHDHPLPAHLQGEALRHAMKEAVAGALTLLAGQRPLVLLLEDWHWADDASRAVLTQIAEVAPDHALLAVVTTRPGSADAGGAPRRTLLSLEPLGAEASADMLRTVTGARALPPQLAEHVHARTGGNPFFIEEVGRSLIEEGTLRVRDGTAFLVGSLQALQLPDTVEAVIRARIDRLDRDSREVVRVASVIGREFERRLLEQAMQGGSRLPHALQTLKAAGLIHQVRVVPDAGYRFNHVLTQEVAYASLLERQRVELHGRLAGVIETLHQDSLDEHYDGLAHHFSRAGQWDKAVHYGMAAAERSTALSAFADALQQLERCEEWLRQVEPGQASPRLLVDVLLREERLCETIGLRARQQQLIDRLIDLLEHGADRASLAEAYLRQGDLYTLLRRFPQAERALLQSLELRRSIGDPYAIRASLRSLGLLRWHEGREHAAIPFIEETLEIDRRQGDAESLVADLSNLGAVLKGMGDLQRARAALESALRELQGQGGLARREIGAVMKECYLHHNLANVHRALGEPEVAMEHLEAARRSIERERLPIQLSYHFTSIAHMYLRQNRVEESLELYARAVEAGRRSRFSPGLSQVLRIQGEVLLGLGRDAEALPGLVEAAGLFAQLQDVAAQAGLWRQIAAAHERLGAPAQAVSAWRRAAELSAQLEDASSEVEAREGVARAARRAGMPAEETIAAHLAALACAERADERPARARLLNTLGIMAWERADYGEALSRYEAALEVLRDLGDDAGTGLILNSIGVILKALGRREEARQRLEDALAVHARSGRALLEGHALALLGDLALEERQPGRAIGLFARSLQLRQSAGDRPGEGWMHLRLARAHLARDEGDAAARHLTAARQIASDCGAADLDAALRTLEQTLGTNGEKPPCRDSSSNATSAA